MAITDSSGAGKKILSNLNSFHFILEDKKSDVGTDKLFFILNVDFVYSGQVQKGKMNITFDENSSGLSRISQVTLDLDDFGRPLGSYNDNSLINLGDYILKTYGF